jgi:hypothetical protein
MEERWKENVPSFHELSTGSNLLMGILTLLLLPGVWVHVVEQIHVHPFFARVMNAL